MKIYEVVFWGSRGKGDEKDTIYLVRSPDFKTAVECVTSNGSPDKHGLGDRIPDTVYEIGTDTSPTAEKAGAIILRGPYFESAHNLGWRCWTRNTDNRSGWEEAPPR